MSGSLVRGRACLVAMLVSAAALPAAFAADAADPWVAEFRRYAAQSNLANDQSYTEEPAPVFRFDQLLRQLPAPAKWPGLRQDFAAAAATTPEGVERQQLLAGGWLCAYLVGDRASILPALPPKPADDAEMTEASYALGQLRESLEELREEDPASAEKMAQVFEQQIATLEPVSLDEVKRVLGGEENFARLKRLLDAGAVMQQRAGAVYEEYQRTKDEAAAREKMEALRTEFEAAHGKDQQALEPYMNNPVVGSYLRSLWQAQQSETYTPNLTVPDLVTPLGMDGARQLLRRAFALPASLSVFQRTGEATQQLAREEALAAIDTMKVPSWGLVQSVEAVPLFEAMRKRFPVVKPNATGYDEACGYYLVALIQQGRVPEALAFATRPGVGDRLTLPYQVVSALEESGQAEPLWQFLAAWLRKFPGSGEWDRFSRLSAQLGHEKELKAMVAAMSAEGSFAGLDRVRVQRMQAGFELATDDLDAARQRFAALLQPIGQTPSEHKAQLEIAEKLLQLAGLQQDTASYQATAATAETILAASWAGESREALEGTVDLMEAFNEAGRFADAARIGQSALDRIPVLQAKAEASGRGEEWKYMISPYSMRRLLGELLRANIELGRWAEAGKLVHDNPSWGAGDVQDLLDDKVASANRPLGCYFAQVAHQQGLAPVERRLLEAQLVSAPGADSVYQSYLALVPPAEAKEFLARLIAADRYEERPLIWRAKLESDAGEWDAAIATLQQAIQIDPSDGEQGRGDRMRVYAYMGRAMAAKGDKEKAAFLENVVKSIRLSETADRWFSLGAYTRAIALYRQALGFFQDAYCIQSRLAVRLAGEGKMDEAVEHYRRAFELMPDSFGRVESHCFGCEHVFAGEKSQGVAEEVFTRMLAARPDKPQLHYLMGYLREEQKQYKEAAEHFRQAVKLDPLYLNAWKHLAGLDSELHFTPAERDDLAFKMLELDPLRRHGGGSLEKVTDLARLWSALQAADRVIAQLPAPGPVWALPGSAAELGANKSSGMPVFKSRNNFGDILAEHPFVDALQTYLASLVAEPEPNEEPPATQADR